MDEIYIPHKYLHEFETWFDKARYDKEFQILIALHEISLQ